MIKESEITIEGESEYVLTINFKPEQTGEYHFIVKARDQQNVFPVQVIASVVRPQLELVDPETKKPASDYVFKMLYFNQQSKHLIVRNPSPFTL